MSTPPVVPPKTNTIPSPIPAIIPPKTDARRRSPPISITTWYVSKILIQNVSINIP